MVTNILTSLEDWGCDVEGAMNRFLEDEELYLTCLETVITDEAFDKLGTALTERQEQEAFDSAHTLKGVFANLGLTPMFEIVVDIVEPLRNGKCEGLQDDYRKLLDANQYLKQVLGK